MRTISPMADGVGKRLLLPHCLSGRKTPPGIRHYRVDRMAGVLVLDEPRRGKEQFFRPSTCPPTCASTSICSAAPSTRVTLRCTADLEPVMRERFGASPIFCPEEDGHFHFDVPICVSDQFYGWVCGFGGKVEVTAPRSRPRPAARDPASLAEQPGKALCR